MRKLSEFLLRRKTAQRLADAHLEDHHAHAYLGNMYLALGDTAQAELEYSRAYALFPSEEVRAQLAAIRKTRAERYSTDRYVPTARRAA